jgi:hypothetical protein
MSKKILIAGIGVLLLAASLATLALAAPNQAEPMDPPNPPGPRGGPGRNLLWGPPHLAGEITEIGEGEFTATIEGNSQIVVEVSEDTSYLGVLESFSDLEIGLEVVVAGHRSGEYHGGTGGC